jgi:zinc transport system substrate-binding protein
MRRTRHRALFVVGACLAATVAGAIPAGAMPARSHAPIPVVAGFYPVAWAAEQVGGPNVAVRNLTPAGAEPHDLELTTDQRDAIDDAAVVVVMGRNFQPAVESAAEQRDHGTVELLDRIGLADAGPLAHDPHVWLDPTLMGRIVDEITKALITARPADRAVFTRRAAALHTKLDALDARYRTGLASCRRDTIVTAHEAFGHLAHAYGLRQEGVSGLSPDGEPDARRLAALADLVRARGVTTVFTERLVSPRIAQTLAREAGGVRTAVLDPIEGLTAKERAAGHDYLTEMDANLAKLRTALDCA